MIRRVYETVLYAAEVDATATFYVETLGLRRLDPPDRHSAALRLPDGGVLLLFDPARSSGSDRFVPAHGARGPGHIAFSVGDGELDAAAARLASAGLEIEREIAWPRGGRSVYVRDPAGNSVELVEGEIWEDP